MAIAIDTTTNPDAGGGSASSPYSWSHTCSGTDRGLFVITDASDTGGTSGVTYNGVAMTKIGSNFTLVDRILNLWYLANPASGANNISVTFTGGFMRVAAASYTGMAQSGQPEAQGQTTNTSTSISQSVTVATANAWLIGIAGADGGSLSAGTNTTVRVSTGGSTIYAIIDSNGPQATGSRSLAATMSSGSNGINIGSFAPVVAPTALIKTRNGVNWADIKTINGAS